MAWLETRKLKRSLPVNGEMLRFLRNRRGWTQEDLASKAGYSERAVRKAESSGGLHPDTIEILAEDRDRDPDCSEAPPTPPGVRVRTGRFISSQ